MAAGLPSSVIVAIEFTAGVWTAVSTSVIGDSIDIRVGREGQGTDPQPGLLTLDLDNLDGTFTPNNPLSTYYPNLVEGKRIRVQVVKSATTYTRFVGRITNLQPEFPTNSPNQSVTHLTAVDHLGDLARITLPSVPWAKAMQYTAPDVAFYPLSGTNEANGPVDVAGSLSPMTRRDVSTAGSLDFASDDSLGDGLSYVTMTAGTGLWHASNPSPFSGRANALVVGFDFRIMVKVNAGSYGEVVSASYGRRSTATDYVSVRWAATGFIIDTYQSGTLTGSSTAVAASAGWHVLRVDVAAGTLWVDEGSSVSAPIGISSADCVSIGGALDMSAANLMLGNFNTTAPIYAPASVLPGLSTPDVLGDLEDCIRATGLQLTLAWTGTPSMTAYAPLVTAGRSALDVLLDVARSQGGIAYHDYSTSATQTVKLLSNDNSRPTTVSLTVDIEADADGPPVLARGIEGNVSEATARSFSNSATVRDTSLDATVGAASVTIDTVLSDTNDLQAVASDAISRGKYDGLRLAVLPIDLVTAANDLYATAFATTPGERVRTSNLPSTYLGVTYMDGYAQGWTERPGVDGYSIVYDLSPADAPSEAVFDTARFAFGDGICTVTSGTAVGTSSTGTIVLTWTGGAALSTSAGDYPLDLNWNGERVTVTSAPAGSSSPQTLTITARGVAPSVARSHSAGEAIDLWDAGRYAL